MRNASWPWNRNRHGCCNRCKERASASKTFIPLVVKYNVSGEFPSTIPIGNLHDKALGRDDLQQARYREPQEHAGVHRQHLHHGAIDEELQTNLALLRKHPGGNIAAAKPTLEVELLAFASGTLYGHLSRRIVGADRAQHQAKAPHDLTFVAGYTNGYIYYAPPAAQLTNTGTAQEDCDCLLAPAWRQIFRTEWRRCLTGYVQDSPMTLISIAWALVVTSAATLVARGVDPVEALVGQDGRIQISIGKARICELAAGCFDPQSSAAAATADASGLSSPPRTPCVWSPPGERRSRGWGK